MKTPVSIEERTRITFFYKTYKKKNFFKFLNEFILLEIFKRSSKNLDEADLSRFGIFRDLYSQKDQVVYKTSDFKKKMQIYPVSFLFLILLEKNIFLEKFYVSNLLDFLALSNNFKIVNLYYDQILLEKKITKNQIFRIYLKKIQNFSYNNNFEKGKIYFQKMHSIIKKEIVKKRDMAKFYFYQGIMSVKKNEMPEASSFFFEAYENISLIKGKISIRIFEASVLSMMINNNYMTVKSSCITKTLFGNMFMKSIIFLANCLIHNDLTGLELLILHKKSRLCIHRIFNAKMIEIYFKILKKHISDILRNYIRISLLDISLINGVSRKNVKYLITNMLLNKKINGIIDKKKKVLINFRRPFDFSIMKSCFKICIKINFLLSKLLKK